MAIKNVQINQISESTFSRVVVANLETRSQMVVKKCKQCGCDINVPYDIDLCYLCSERLKGETKT